MVKEESKISDFSHSEENFIIGTKETENKSKNLLDKVKQKIPGLRIAIPKDQAIEPQIFTPNLMPMKSQVALPSPIPLSPHCKFKGKLISKNSIKWTAEC